MRHERCRSALRIVGALVLGLLVSCGAADGDGRGGSGASGAAGVSAITAGAAHGGAGRASSGWAGNTSLGMAGSSDASPMTPPAANDDAGIEHECAGVSAKAEPKLMPTDVVWAIDTSGSMAFTFEAIQNALGSFSRKVVEAGIDAHIVLLAGATGGRLSTTGLCVPMPLGSGQCGAGSSAGHAAQDTKEPTFLHLDTPIAANEGMGVLLDSYPAFKHMLRAGARTHLVMTEDGAPPMSANAVADHIQGIASATSMPAWMPGLAAGSWVWSGVVCPDGLALGSCILSSGPPATTLQLISTTGGVLADLNTVGQQGFDPFAELLDKLATKVVVEAKLGCSYDIPPAPAGMTFDAGQVNVVYTDGNSHPNIIGRAPDGRACEQREAWQYDDPNKPTKVVLCPAACSRVQADPHARLDVKFGCETKVLGPD